MLEGRDFLNETNPNQKTLVKSRESLDELPEVFGVEPDDSGIFNPLTKPPAHQAQEGLFVYQS